MSFAVFVFVALTWSPSGGLDRPMVMTALNRHACEVGRADFLAAAAAQNAAVPYAFRKGFAATRCELAASRGKSV